MATNHVHQDGYLLKLRGAAPEPNNWDTAAPNTTFIEHNAVQRTFRFALFFGPYWMLASPAGQTTTLCCLDLYADAFCHAVRRCGGRWQELW